MSTRSISSSFSFKSNISLLTFCLDDLSIHVSGVLRSPTVLLLMSPFRFVSSCFMYISAPMLDAYIFKSDMSSCWSVPFIIIYFPALSLLTCFT